MRAGRWALVVLAGGVWGCGSPPADPPTAVVRAEPSSVCLNDHFETTVRLDASESQPALSLVPVAQDPDGPSLSFEWSFAGADHEDRGRDPSGVELLVATSGDRPLHVTLRVQNEAGGEATTTHSLPITVPAIQPCDAGCPAGSSCVSSADDEVCSPNEGCDHDVDCAVCWRCDDVLSRCVPREVAR